MRAGKPLPVLYTPCQGKRGKYWYKTEIRVQDRTHGQDVYKRQVTDLKVDYDKALMEAYPEGPRKGFPGSGKMYAIFGLKPE